MDLLGLLCHSPEAKRMDSQYEVGPMRLANLPSVPGLFAQINSGQDGIFASLLIA
jgi:hypothetical protein